MAKNALQSAQFIDSNGKSVSGLVPIHNSDYGDLRIDERVVVSEALLFNRVDYIFFRRFSDGRSSQISAYIIDNSDEQLSNEQLTDLHKKVWLQGTVPLMYVAWPGRIDILTCARGPDFWQSDMEGYQYSPAKTFDLVALETASEIATELQTFSALRLADGTFWEEPRNRSLVDNSKASHQSLIQAVVEADLEIDGVNNPTQRRLLLLMILIKYLEDRGVFPSKGWFGRFQKGARTFFDVLRGGNPEKVYNLLDTLEKRFNGDIFDLGRQEPHELTKRDLRTFADLIEARTLKRQRYLWDQFSFEHIPVEIISHLYQHFVQSGHGTIYTPPFLASLLLDNVMSYEKLTGEERILDPACGSGVFLVGAFRRLINVWRSRNNWQRPDVATLKHILRRSIYGIELDRDAIDLTSFSLSLAVCDALQPDVIWKDLKFDPLHTSNLFEGDFFQALIDYQNQEQAVLRIGFDVVIGNPPFESKLSTSGKKVNQVAQQKNKRGSLPDKQTAYLFLEQASSVLRPHGRICLVQPSGFLYNRKALSFRNNFMQKCKVDTILDFTSIRNLYQADPKTIAVYAVGSAPRDDDWIDHWTFRRTVSVHERICFELDHYDRHRVPQKVAVTDPYVWRTNLLGGGRLLSMSQSLRSMRTLAEYVKQEGWDYGEGFIAAKTGRRTPAPFLTGKPLLPTSAFTETGIDEKKIRIVKETRFRSAYTESRYSAPLLLIKESDSLPIAYWDKGFLAYGHRIVGIHTPSSQHLHEFYEYLVSKHRIYRFCSTLHGTESLVDKATAIRKQDIDALPYPANGKELSFSFWEDVLCEDVLEYMTEYVRLGQNSQLLKKAVDVNDLQQYSVMFIRMLGSVYENLHATDPIFLNGLTCQPFFFGENIKLSWLKRQDVENLKRLIYEEKKYAHLRTIRVVRFYSKNILFLVKPDRLRYWLRSVAIRDADETLVDLRQQGY